MARAFDAHAPAEGFRLAGGEKLAFVSDVRLLLLTTLSAHAPVCRTASRAVASRAVCCLLRTRRCLTASRQRTMLRTFSSLSARRACVCAGARACRLRTLLTQANAHIAQTTLWRVLALGWLPRVFRADARVLDVGCGASAALSRPLSAVAAHSAGTAALSATPQAPAG
jgi:hypothetical protein